MAKDSWKSKGENHETNRACDAEWDVTTLEDLSIQRGVMHLMVGTSAVTALNNRAVSVLQTQGTETKLVNSIPALI